jgi:hypothetical protein
MGTGQWKLTVCASVRHVIGKWNDRRDSIFGTLTPRADVINDNQQILAKHSFGEATKRQPQFFSAHLRNEVQSGCAAL